MTAFISLEAAADLVALASRPGPCVPARERGLLRHVRVGRDAYA